MMLIIFVGFAETTRTVFTVREAVAEKFTSNQTAPTP
jgi:hypothetical protein